MWDDSSYNSFWIEMFGHRSENGLCYGTTLTTKTVIMLSSEIPEKPAG